MRYDEIKTLLDQKADLYNRPDFIISDPIQIPHRFTIKEDIEIAGFLAAILSWGQRKTIISKSLQLLSLMDNCPSKFITESSEKEFSRFESFCHRTFNSTDTVYFICSLRNIYKHHGGLQKVFELGFAQEQRADHALIYFRKVFFECDFPHRTGKHIPDVSKGSSAKRLNMYLRWMVRRDSRGVDFGLWKSIEPSWLVMPLDLHSGSTARSLGLLDRKYNDWQAVEELTSKLRLFDSNDPVKYDFALFGMGVFES